MRKSLNLDKMCGMQEGKEFELALFKSVPTNRFDYIKDKDLLLKKNNGKIPLRESIEMVKSHQPENWDPDHPPAEFLRDLKENLGDKLGFRANEEYDTIKCFTAVNSILDQGQRYTADAFVTFFKNGREYFVTYDASLNPKKDAKHPLTVLVQDEKLASTDEDSNQQEINAYLESIDNVADKTIEVLKQVGYFN